MWNITITKDDTNVVDLAEAVEATADTDVKVIEPGDWDGDWLAELSDVLAEELLEMGRIHIENAGFVITADCDKEW